MNKKPLLNGDPTNWLLEHENPAVRYLTLRDVLSRSDTDTELVEAKKDISTDRRIVRIFSKQKPQGYWEDARKPYNPKYKGTYWQVMILSQLGLDKSDERVRRACEFIFQFQLDEGGFSSFEKPSPEKIREYEFSCLTGNVAASLIRLGYGDDERVIKALEWLVEVQNRDGGWLCPYWKAHINDKHSCFMGTITPLEAFSEMPKGKLSGEMESTIDTGVEFLLMHRLFMADHHGFKVINQSWLNLGFPSFFYDVLRGLSVVTKLGYVKDERIHDALEVLLEKRGSDGRWTLDSSPVGRMHATLEQKGEPSKWITLHALKVIKRVHPQSMNFPN